MVQRCFTRLFPQCWQHFLNSEQPCLLFYLGFNKLFACQVKSLLRLPVTPMALQECIDYSSMICLVRGKLFMSKRKKRCSFDKESPTGAKQTLFEY